MSNELDRAKRLRQEYDERQRPLRSPAFRGNRRSADAVLLQLLQVPHSGGGDVDAGRRGRPAAIMYLRNRVPLERRRCITRLSSGTALGCGPAIADVGLNHVLFGGEAGSSTPSVAGGASCSGALTNSGRSTWTARSCGSMADCAVRPADSPIGESGVGDGVLADETSDGETDSSTSSRFSRAPEDSGGGGSATDSTVDASNAGSCGSDRLGSPGEGSSGKRSFTHR